MILNPADDIEASDLERLVFLDRCCQPVAIGGPGVVACNGQLGMGVCGSSKVPSSQGLPGCGVLPIFNHAMQRDETGVPAVFNFLSL